MYKTVLFTVVKSCNLSSIIDASIPSCWGHASSFLCSILCFLSTPFSNFLHSHFSITIFDPSLCVSHSSTLSLFLPLPRLHDPRNLVWKNTRNFPTSTHPRRVSPPDVFLCVRSQEVRFYWCLTDMITCSLVTHSERALAFLHQSSLVDYWADTAHCTIPCDSTQTV